MNDQNAGSTDAPVERQKMKTDVVCVGFGPAAAGFLTTLSRELTNPDGTPKIESPSMPGMPLQVICYERADDIGVGVSGVVSKARAIRASFPDTDLSQIPLAAPVAEEKLVYLLDPHGASRRSLMLRVGDKMIRACKGVLPFKDDGLELPFIPPFMQKHGGAVFSIGQLNSWVGMQLMSSGTVQIWPGTPISSALLEGSAVKGVRLSDQGVEKSGAPADGYMPGMDVEADLTVVADGPVGAIGQQLDEKLGMPEGHHKQEWAVGMKFVITLREGCDLKPGTVFHTFGYPEPGIFGFMYVYPGNTASLGIFVPSWFENPVRTSYRYLQHWMLHPYIWKHVQGGTLRSWGAKSLQEAGKRGEPHLCGDGFARIGEGSGSTNVLTGSGVDEAWATGVQLAEAVVELAAAKKPFTKENLEATYVQRRRASWVEKEGRVAEKSRDGFHHGVLPGLFGMALAGFTGGLLSVPTTEKAPYRRLKKLEDYFADRIPADEISRIKQDCRLKNTSLHDALMDRSGWPAIPFDGTLLVSHQDALLMGGKVQAAAGYADHVRFQYPELCKSCGAQLCVEMCSGQAITPGETGVPVFDREKCVHCGACLWNCAEPISDGSDLTNIIFGAGAGGLHSAEN